LLKGAYWLPFGYGYAINSSQILVYVTHIWVFACSRHQYVAVNLCAHSVRGKSRIETSR